jgi:hypothetical protein
LCGVFISKGEDSFEAIPKILAGSTTGDQSWDVEVPQVPQSTCLVEVLEERERAVAGEEIHEVTWNGVHSVEDASIRGLLLRQLQWQVLPVREPVGRGERRKKRGLQLHWIPPCQRQGLCWTLGGGLRWKTCEGPAQSSAQIAAACVVEVLGGTREEPGTLTQGVTLFSLVPLVWN